MASKEGGSLGPENQKRLLQTLFFLPNTDLGFIRGIVEKLPNRWAEMGEFLAWAILANKRDVAEYLISEGAVLTDPPHELSSDTYGLPAEATEALKSYRRTPFLLLAASRGSPEMVELLISKGAQIAQTGFIGTSRSRLNYVISNVLGAATFHGKPELVSWLLNRFRPEELAIELPTIEERNVSKTLTKEYSACTPLLLAVHRNDSPEIAEILLSHGANINAVDWQQNNAMHIAANLKKTEMIRFLNKAQGRLKGERNAKGETAVSIAKGRNDREILELLGEEDQSAREAEELIKLLGQEEQKKPSKPRKKKQPAADPKPSISTVPQTVQPLLQVPETKPEPVVATPTPQVVVEEKKPSEKRPKTSDISVLVELMSRLQEKEGFGGLTGEELGTVKRGLESALREVEKEVDARAKGE